MKIPTFKVDKEYTIFGNFFSFAVYLMSEEVIGNFTVSLSFNHKNLDVHFAIPKKEKLFFGKKFGIGRNNIEYDCLEISYLNLGYFLQVYYVEM